MTIHLSPSVQRGLVMAVTMSMALSGCTLIPDALRAVQLSHPADSSSPAVSSTPIVLVPVKNDLETGSAHHVLAGAGVTVTASYWSTLRMDRWSSAIDKPITFCLTATLDTDVRRSIYLSRVSIITTVHGPSGLLAPPPLLSDTASVSPGYLITSPYTYSQIFTIPAVPAHARSVTLAISYEILVQSTPKSTVYAKQATTDEITIALAQPATGK